MDEQAKRKWPTYSDEFKRDAVRLVVEEGYSFKAVRQAVGVCDATLRDWHRKLLHCPSHAGRMPLEGRECSTSQATQTHRTRT